jgi:signal transduction histidine kinase
LAVGYSALISWALVIQLRPIYVLLITAMVMVVFGALLSWRSFAERERIMAQLRPFAASQDLYESVAVDEQHDVDPSALFDALCGEVLGASRAFLVPLGPLAPLLESPVVYPREEATDAASSIASMVQPLVSGRDARLTTYFSLDPDCPGGARWAVPLWGERGLIGAMLLGDKRDGGLYTEEEIEIARGGGERLLDTLAAVESARRLMALMQERIAQIRLMEGHGRRILHDEVLPQLHAAVLYLDREDRDPAVSQAVEALTVAHHQISDLMRDAVSATPQRLVVEGPVAALGAMIRKDYAEVFNEIDWQIEPRAEAASRQLAPHVSEVLYFAAQELVRNAARHGRGKAPDRPLHLRIIATIDRDLRLCIEDDGIGYSASLGRVGGRARDRGHGLRFHGTMLMAVGARLEVETIATGGTRGQIIVPIDLV